MRRVCLLLLAIVGSACGQLIRSGEIPPPQWVQCQSTKGPLRVRLYPEWAPLGVARFLDMVDGGFFNDVSVFRVVPNFVAQFGVAAKPEVHAAWRAKGPLKDDPNLGIAWKRGMISFAGSGPNTRTTQLFIGFKDSSTLGLPTSPWETPLGFVDMGVETIDKFYSGYGDLKAMGGKGPDSFEIEKQGNELLKKDFPLLDYITSCERIAPPAPTPRPTRPPRTSPRPASPQPPGPGPQNPAPAAAAAASPAPLKCEASSCGNVFSANAKGTSVLCSCHSDCMKAKNCCDSFEQRCPEQFAAGTLAAKALAAVSCNKDNCGGSLASDREGKNIICSCYYTCVEAGTCCPKFESMCPAEAARATEAAADAAKEQEEEARALEKKKNGCKDALGLVKPQPVNMDCENKAYNGFVIKDKKCTKVQACKRQRVNLNRFKTKAACENFLTECKAMKL